MVLIKDPCILSVTWNQCPAEESISFDIERSEETTGDKFVEKKTQYKENDMFPSTYVSVEILGSLECVYTK